MSEELRISHALDTISKNPNGTKALEILSIITYFAPEDIHIDILSSLVTDEKELGAVVRLLKRYSIVHSGKDQTSINIDKTVQKIMITIIDSEKKEVHVIKKALALLFMQGINPNNLEHVISVWSYVSPYPQLIERFCGIPSIILSELNNQLRYEQGIKFGWKAIDLLTKSIGKTHPGMWVLEHNMGLLLGMAGEHKKALKVLLPLYEHNMEHSGLRDTLSSTARQLGEMSRYREAFEIYQDTLFLNKKVSDSNDDQMLAAWHDYAHILSDTGKYDEASQILKDILKRRKKIVETEDEYTLSLRSSLAHVLVKESKYSEALKIFYQVFEKRKALLGDNNIVTLRSRRDIALVFQHQGRLDEALAIYEVVTEEFKQHLGIEHTETLAIQANVATLYQQRGEYQKALDTYKYIYKKQSKMLGEKHAEPLQVKYHIATILFIQEKHDEALQTLQEVYKAYIEVFGPNHHKTLDLKTTLETLNSVKLETIYSAAWEGDLAKAKTMIQSGIDINNTDFCQKTPLHYAAECGNTNIVRLLLEKGAIYNGESVEGKTPIQLTTNNVIKNLLTLVGKFFKDAKEGDYHQVFEDIMKNTLIINAKDNDGSNAIHWAAYNGHKDIVKLLLESGADGTQVTNKGNTPLHIATSKGHKEIIEVLLQSVSRNEIHNFINAKTTIGGATSIHVAAKNGSLDIVKSLLKHGAIYNIKNKQGKTPVELSKDRNITNLLNLSDELFQYAKNGHPKIISKLHCIESDDLIALTSARNDEGNTLLQVIITNKHEQIASKFLEMVKKPDQTESTSGYEYILSLDQIEKLKRAAALHIRFSQTHLSSLRRLSDPHGSEENLSPWATFKNGSYCLGNAQKLVEVYKSCIPGSIQDKNIQLVKAALVELGFDRTHITKGYTNDAYDGQAFYFDSSGEGTKHYKLLRSKLKKDVRSFIELFERRINIPIKQFSESLERETKPNSSEKLFKAIENNNYFEFENCIREGVDVNVKNTDGGTALHHAVNSGNISIIHSLLKYGADMTQVTSKGNTPLHIATSKGHTEIVEVLLQHVNRDELNDLVNAQTTVGGTTSLHVAAKNGSMNIVKSLLKHGAIFDIENKEGKLPIDLSRDRNIKNFLEIVSVLFQAAEIGILEIINELPSFEPDEFVALKNSRNNQGHTLLQVAIVNKHAGIESKLLEMYKRQNQIHSSSNLKSRLDQFKKLKASAEKHILNSSKLKFLEVVETSNQTESSSGSESIFSLDQIKNLRKAAMLHIRFSKSHLSSLRVMSQPCGSEENDIPSSTLKTGSHYLENAHKLVEVYKSCIPGSIQDRNIQAVNGALVDLGFDSKHITEGYTDEVCHGQDLCFVSKGKGTKYYKLLHSKLKKDVKLFVETVERRIDVPVKRFLESLERETKSDGSEKLFKAIENNNLSEVEECIRDRVSINLKHTDGGTPLHHAVNNGNLGIVNVLLENGADATQVTTKGNTPLHIATSKGYEEIVEVLLQDDELNDIVNAQTTVGGTAPLHVAAKNGFIKIVKSLLKHGAIYDIKNKDGKTPLDLSKHSRVTNLLNLIKKLFHDAKNGNFEIIGKLEPTELDEFIALTNTHNNEGNTLLKVAINNKHKNITSEFLELFRKPDQIQSLPSPKCKLEQFAMLQEVADVHIKASQLYLLELRSISQSCNSEKNLSPWTTLKAGSYYLSNAHSLVEIYKWCTNSPINNKYIQAVNDVLVALEFDPKQVTLYTNEVCNEQVECFISKGQGTKYFKLLHSESKKNVRLFIELVERNIDIPVKKFLESIKERLQDVIPEKLFFAIETNSYTEVENCIREGAFVNIQHTDGATPLHHAVHNGNLDIVNILLENDADITEVTDKGNTPLHTATSKGHKEIVEILLKRVSQDKFNDFINAQTVGGTTSLHIAAKNGSWDIVKSLLKHGAIYDMKNKEGKTPLDLSKDKNITDLLKLFSELFEDAKYGNPGIISKLQNRDVDEFIVITKVCNSQGNTLLQVAEKNNHKSIASMLSEMLKNPDQIRSWCVPKFNLNQIEKLKEAAELYIQCTESYLTMLRNSSQSNRSEKNSFPWATLKAGSYYLQNVHSLVEVYKGCVRGPINDENIQAVNYILVELEFDPKHITSGYTDEAFDGKVECFVSKGQGTKYYELLHSDLKKDVRLFIKMVEPDIDVHVNKFLKSIKEELKLVLSGILFDAIENNNNSEVRSCLREELVVNFESADGRIPLHHAINTGNISIINTLLKHGADVTQLNYKGETPLHIASSKGNKRIIEVLLQHVRQDALNDFINAQTVVGGTTSLHIAAKNGSLEVVESLLKHGAVFNIKDQKLKTALDLSNDQNVTNLLKFIQSLFEDAKCGNFKIIRKLKTQPYKFTAITNTRNDQGKSLVQVAIFNKHQALAGKIETIIKTRSNNSSGY